MKNKSKTNLITSIFLCDSLDLELIKREISEKTVRKLKKKCMRAKNMIILRFNNFYSKKLSIADGNKNEKCL